MALQKQAVTINLSGGLDTKTTKKHIMPGKLAVLENGVYRKSMEIAKRYGYTNIPNFDLNNNALGSGTEVDVFNDELLLYNDQKLYGLAEGVNRWVDKGQTINVVISSEQVIKNISAQSNADGAILNNIGVYAWEDSRGGVRFSVIDDLSNSIIQADTFLDVNGVRVRCFVNNPYIFIFYVTGAQLRVRRVNSRDPADQFGQVLTAAVVDANNTYDMISLGENIFIVYNNSSGTVTGIWLNREGVVLASGLYVTRTYAFGDMDSCCSLALDSDNNILLYFHNAAGEIRRVKFNQYGIFDSNLLVTNSFAAVTNMSVIAQTEPVTNTFRLFFSIPGGTPDVTLVRKLNDSNGTFGTSSVVIRSVGLYSKAFAYIDSNNNRIICLGVAHESTLQSTYFVVTEDGLIIGKQQYTNGGGLRPALKTLATVTATNDIYSYAIAKKNQIVSENATIFTPTGVMQTKVDFTNSSRFIAKQLGNNLLIVGGVLNMYDGQSIVEHGFLLYPERVVATAVGSGGSLADGSYQVFIVYEWTDNYGQIHRSRPSVAETVTCSAGGTDSITVTAPTLRITRKNGTTRAAVSIVGYITEANGTIAYRFTSISTPILNSLTADTVSLGTITSVSTSNQILYTTGTVLANDPAPACSVIEVFQNRAWLGGLEDASQVYFSKENKSGFPVEFTDEFTKSITSAGGKITALTFIDDKLLAMKADTYFITYGDGPNDTNTLGGFSEFENISVDVGCEEPRSISKLPVGIILKTKKGIYSIDRSLNITYIGAEVEGFNSLDMTSANLITNSNEVCFTNSDGDMLVYNYFYNRWSTAKPLQSVGAVIWKNKLVLLKTDGSVWKQNTGEWKDAEGSYQLVMESGWISLGNLSSYKRIYQLIFFGDYKSQHKVRIKIAYDNNEAWEHSGIYDPTTEFPVEFYGDASPYGENNTVYGGSPIDYAIVVKLKRQKCSSFRFRFEELITSATAGTQESLTISDVGILVGMKQGVVKKNQNRNMKVN